MSPQSKIFPAGRTGSRGIGAVADPAKRAAIDDLLKRIVKASN